MSQDEAELRERAFHDAWARSEDIQHILVKESFEAPTALEAGYIRTRMGNLAGKRVLDFGCGLGEAAVYFALQGARVTAFDLSAEMTAKAQKVAAAHGVHIETLTGNAESFDLPAGAFDFIYSSNLIHHLQDRDAFFHRIKMALAPGGVFYSWDPLTYNPIIWIYRLIAFGVRTVDERPLRTEDLRLIKRHFPEAKFRFFWLSGLLIFVKYFCFDRLHPGKVRYWKHVLKETESSLRWWWPLYRIDGWLTKIPVFRLLSWTIVVEARNEPV